MATVDEVIKRIKALRPPRLAAGSELNEIEGPVTALEAYAVIEAARLFCDLPNEFKEYLKRLSDFTRRTAPLKFSKLSRGRVAVEVAARMLNNKLVSQKEFGICGPAAVAMETAQTRPGEYLKIAMGLAEDGRASLRDLLLKPSDQILNYDPGGSIPEADWIVCASIRNEPVNLEKEFSKESYGGSSTQEVFDWMVKAGYRKVIAVDHNVFMPAVYVYPPESRPPGIDPEDKKRCFDTMKDFKQRGWLVLMGCNMSLERGIESMKQVALQHEEMEELMGTSAANSMMSRTVGEVRQKLEEPNPGRFQTLVNVGKMLVSGAAGEGHWVYLEKLESGSLDQSMFSVTMCSHGQRFSAVKVPANGMINKYSGFVAVTDLV